MDPNTVDGRIKLLAAVDSSDKKMQSFRDERKEFVKRYAGSHYSENGADQSTSVNEVAQAIETWVQQLAGGDPRALVVAHNPAQSAIAYDQSLALDKEAKRMKMRRKVQRLVQQAIFGMGIARVGTNLARHIDNKATFPDLGINGMSAVGQIAIDVISMDQWVHDFSADSIDGNVQFCGHRYRVDRRDLGEYLGKDIKESDIPAGGPHTIGATNNADSTAMISRGSDAMREDDLVPKVWLWDIWLPREKVIVTIPVDGNGTIAKVQKWTGPVTGPYIFLWYAEIVDQVMPKSILGDLVDLHDLSNSIFNKLVNQATRQKVYTAYQTGFKDDAEIAQSAGDGDMVGMRDPNMVQEKASGGINNESMAMWIQTSQIFSRKGGNLDTLGGLQAQSGTVGQDQLLAANASKKIEHMQRETTDFVVEIFEAMRYWLWHDQVTRIPIQKVYPGTDLQAESYWSVERTENQQAGLYDGYEMKIVPYSLQYRSPEQRGQLLIKIWNEVVMPSMASGMMQEAPDLNEFLRVLSEYLDLPELKNILKIIDLNTMAQGQGASHRASQAPVTTRKTIREGRPGMTQDGQNDALTRMLMGSKLQASEANGITSGGG